jgi:hypothetical protein
MKNRVMYVGVWWMGFLGGCAFTGWGLKSTNPNEVGVCLFLACLFLISVTLALMSWEMEEKK